MATVITRSEPSVEHDHYVEGSNNTGLIVGVILVLLVLFLFFYYGLPALRGGFSTSPQINVPGKVDVNVNKGQ